MAAEMSLEKVINMTLQVPGCLPWPDVTVGQPACPSSECSGLMLQIRAGPVARARSWWTFRHTLQVAGRLFAGGPGCASSAAHVLCWG